MSAVTLHSRSDGPADAPPLLLANSLGTTLDMWDPQVQRLGDRHRIVRFDNRGHGGSPAPAGPYAIADLGADVLALMDSRAIDRAAFCGVSIGGMIGQWLAINAPERIDRLVVVCSTGRVENAGAFTERAATVRAAGETGVVADAVVARWFTEAFAATHEAFVDRHRAMIAGTPAEGYASCCEAVAGHDERAGLGSVIAPTLVLAGAQDASIPPAQGEQLAAAIPGARFVLLDPAAHLASAERPDAVSQLIDDFLKGPA